MPSPITPGLLILHGNQMEQLRAAVFGWLRANPLAPLEAETILVQSNGVAEWLKIALAEELNVCAATRVALPARFLWEAYRGMLGPSRVPRSSAFDKQPLTWRLMRLLPVLLADPVFAPLAHFLGDGDPERRLQLAERLSDLFDQYQVYRADWLADWAMGHDQIRDAAGQARALPHDQRWQAQLWRAVIASLPQANGELGRATIHQHFVQACQQGEAPKGVLPRRVVIFGVSSLPYQSLQALAMLASHTQVLLAVPNPCRYYWGDIIDGRELLRASRKRQQQRGIDLATVPLEELHAHSHPLLASWGRQGRDFVRMLDEFDNDTAQAASRLRIDLFDEGEGAHLLGQLQAAVRDMLPLAEHARSAPHAEDRSIEFHIAHSVQREVEVLHDRLLAMFAGDTGLRPRDVVVMVPDIDTFSAAIHAVFDQYKRGDARLIPFEIGDVKDRSVNPLLVALEWLLHLPQQRCRQSEVRDLLDVPALAARFGLCVDDLPTLGQWIEGAGVRWGLDQAHRDGLGLGAAGEQNAWIFGVRRMLLGYASGMGHSFRGIEPYAEVGGLDAALAGGLAQLVETLLVWRAALAQQHSPAEWGELARALMAAFFDAREEGDRQTLNKLDEALRNWLDTCDKAGFVEAVPLGVLREAWLGMMAEPTLNHQFVSGGVTFCTLMPMRAVPFKMVCLLGMNDGDFPRRAPKADFDLLALPGMARPGDRSRRDDDRYLMLEAVLAAREKLYISWVGRNVRDNTEQPPSVLVSQLRDYLAAGWLLDLRALTTEHALQPFSRRYFEQGGLPTYAREWRAAHGADGAADEAALPRFELEQAYRLKLGELASFLKQPARYFFRRRLSVSFIDSAAQGEDEEPFSLDGMERYALESRLLDDAEVVEGPAEARAMLAERSDRLAMQGALPIGLVGTHVQHQIVKALTPVWCAWVDLGRKYSSKASKLSFHLEIGDVKLEDWIDHLCSSGTETAWLMKSASKIFDKQGKPRAEKLIDAWLRQLGAAAAGQSVAGYLVTRDAVVQMHALDASTARATLAKLVEHWRANLDQPLTLACRTALAFLQGADTRLAFSGEPRHHVVGDFADACVARLWPNYEAFCEDGSWQANAQAVYGPLLEWLGTSVTISPLDDGGGQ